MSIPEDQAVYRIHRFHQQGEKPKKYRCTLEMTDDRTHQVTAMCDLVGQAMFSTLTIMDHEQQIWHMKPNRKIMPSRWLVTDPNQQVVMQFDQRILGKLANPLTRVALILLDGQGKEVYRLVDPNTNIPDRIVGIGSGEWAIMDGDQPVAKMVWLTRQEDQPTGLFGKLKAFLRNSDRGIISAGSTHVLPAPVALGMLLIFNEVTDISS